MVTASALACDALGLKPPANLKPADAGPCSLCGRAIRAGEAAGTFDTKELGAYAQLSAIGDPVCCAQCAAVLSNPAFLTVHSRAVFTKTSVFRLTQAKDVAWMLLEAKPPFAAVYNVRKSAHVLWYAPVTHDRRAIGIVWAGVTGLISPERVLSARSALESLTDHANAALGARYGWAVENLSLLDDSIGMCELMPSHEHWLRRQDDTEIRQQLERFDRLTLCERWALSALILAHPMRGELSRFEQPPSLVQA